MTTITACCGPIGESALDRDQAERLAGWFAILSDPVRLRLLSMISERDEVCACELVEPLEVSQPTVSHHLKALHGAGLLDRDRRGRQVFYRPVPERLAVLSAALASDGGDRSPVGSAHGS